jgi:hypothetical protein
MAQDGLSRAALDLECSPTTPQRVRSWLRSKLAVVLDDSPGATGLVDDALLCTTELVTNALQAECTTATVRYALTEAVLRLTVHDDARGLPHLRTPTPTDTSGRGLLLVSAIAHQSGVTQTSSGKEVWAEIQRPA